MKFLISTYWALIRNFMIALNFMLLNRFGVVLRMRLSYLKGFPQSVI